MSSVLLEEVLRQQLARINNIEYKGRDYIFSEANLSAAIIALRELPVQNGFVASNKAAYDLVTLGKSFEQVVEGDRKSFSLRYIDWEHAENNIFHVAEGGDVILRANRNDDMRPIWCSMSTVIPMVVMNAKPPPERSYW
jgi:type I restriction enzyme R subunit